MAENEGQQIPTKKSNDLDPHEKKWRIVDLHGEQNSRGKSAKDSDGLLRRKSGFPVKSILSGIVNLFLIFLIGVTAYFGFVYYKNNKDNLFKKDVSDRIPPPADEEEVKALDERMEEIKEEVLGEEEITKEPPPPEKKILRIAENSLGYLNIRNAASLQGKIIGKAKPGEEYEYVDTHDKWYNITREGGNGWVHGDYVELISTKVVSPDTSAFSATSTVSANESTSEKRIKVTATPTGFLNVRNAPWGEVIGKIFPNEEYVYTDTKDGWYFIVIRGDGGEDKSGWVFGKYTDEL